MKILQILLICLILFYGSTQQLCPSGQFSLSGIDCMDCNISCQECVNPIECTSC
jgi:hypothetical protein